MSVIQTIRNKYGKVAGAVIAIALIGFIVSDARNGTFGNLFKSESNDVLKVNGVSIDRKEYDIRVKEYETLVGVYNNKPLDDAGRAQMNEQILQLIAYETVVIKACDKLGIVTTEEEKKEMIYGPNAQQLVRDFQIDGRKLYVNEETGQFDPQRVKGIEQQVAKDPQNMDPQGKYREAWEAVKSYVIRMDRINKFNSMFISSLYAPAYIAQHSIEEANNMAAIRYVKIPFTAVNDNDVKVTDDDIKAYMQKHKGLFETDQETRSIDYVSFDIKPSGSDTSRALTALLQAKTDLANAKDKDNETVVNHNSDDQNGYSEAYLNKKLIPTRFADSIINAPVGSVFGPYFENSTYKITKVIDRKELPDSVSGRVILVKTQEKGKDIMSDTAGKMRIDSAVAAIRSGAKFDSVMMRYSDDQGSKKTGGVYPFLLAQMPGISEALSKEFSDFVFYGKVGESKVIKVSNNNFAGYYYVEITEQKSVQPAVKIATISKSLFADDSTVNAIFGKANEFAGKNATAAGFDAAVKAQHLDMRLGENIKVNSFTIQGIGPSRELIKWMYKAKVGDVSQVISIENLHYVVAKLSSIEDKGMMQLNASNRPLLEQRVKDEKKAELLKAKYKSATTIDAIAQAAGQQVMQSDSVILSTPSIPNVGYEPKVVGYAFYQGFAPNTLSPGIQGQGGLYYITVLNRSVKPANPLAPNALMQQRMMEEMQMKNAMSQMLQQAVIRKADIKYNVDNF